MRHKFLLSYLYAFFSGRINRKSFSIGLTATLLISGLFVLLLKDNFNFLLQLLIIISFAYTLSLIIRRLHDINNPWWVTFLALIPVLRLPLLIYLVFFPGTPDKNKHGTKTTPEINLKQDLQYIKSQLHINSKQVFIILFIFSILLHVLYYISAFETQTLSPFFNKVTIGQDFFQIPNGVYAFLHGGTLNGKVPPGINPYIDCCGVNSNVYHPIFTLLIGYPLQILEPWIAFSTWVKVHILTTILLLIFLWHKFRHHKYIYLALSLFLLNSYHYYEIWGNQFHFLLNFFTVLFLYESHKHGDSLKSGIYLLICLLIKPIALLWLIPLLLYRRFKTALIGYGTFAVITLICSALPFGQYYLNFLQSNIPANFAVDTNIYGITHLIPAISQQSIKYLSYAIVVGLILLQIIKKPSLFTIITLWICFSLLFYPLSFIYHMTILAGLFSLGILLNEFSPKKFISIPIILLTLPNLVVIIYNANQISAHVGHNYVLIWQYCIFLLFFFATTLFWQSWTKERQTDNKTSLKSHKHQ